MTDRLFARVIDPKYDPKGTIYLSNVRTDDPFLYSVARVMRVYDTYSDETLHYELHGKLQGLRPDWQQVMVAQNDVVVARVHDYHQVEHHPFYLNAFDDSDPWLYRMSEVTRLTLLGFSIDDIHGTAVDLRVEYKQLLQQVGAWSAADEAASKARQRRVYTPQPAASELYAVLGVRRGATRDEVKKAYRRLARELHPDVNPAPDAHRRFVVVQDAYEQLLVIVS